MSFLYFLEDLRVPVVNEFMLAVTTLGEETAFLVAALIVFWCVDKNKGYYLMAVGFLGTILNHFLKLVFRIPRPWVIDPEFSILEQAREAAKGYSFPSGHTQSAVGTFGCIAAFTQKKWIRWSCIILAALVGFSRMYVGVHTPYDVLVGAGCAVVLVLFFRKVSGGLPQKQMKLLLGGLIAGATLFLLYTEFWPFPETMDAHNLESGVKNAYTILGCLIGVAIVYAADEKWLHFPVKACWWVQILKCAVGLGLVLLVKSGLKAPLEGLFHGHMAARGVRYFLVVLTAGIVWPMSFRYLSKLGEKK